MLKTNELAKQADTRSPKDIPQPHAILGLLRCNIQAANSPHGSDKAGLPGLLDIATTRPISRSIEGLLIIGLPTLQYSGSQLTARER